MDSLIGNDVLQAVERGILVLLMLFGMACLIIFVRRWRAMSRVQRATVRARARLEDDLASMEPVVVAGITASSPDRFDGGESGLAARMVHVALRNAHLCPEALEKILGMQQIRARESLERGTSFLGTVGANAPFLGLTGTVLGILAAFRKMAEQGGGGTEVMSAIAGALIATAAGLLVAIPAVVMYNLLKARVRKNLNALGEIRSLLLARSLQATASGDF